MRTEPFKISKTKPVVLVGGAYVDDNALDFALRNEFPIFAADSGADQLRRCGITPQAVIGDMDSINDLGFWRGKSEIIHIEEQETTDFEKCLYTISAPKYFCFGFLGERFDHSLAALHVLAKHPNREVYLISKDDVIFAQTGNCAIQVNRRDRVSVYPLDVATFTGSTGLKYPLDGLSMKIGDNIGTSNEATEPVIEIHSDSGTYAVIIDVKHFPQFIP